ncbi:MAG TPA: twin-arginine translocation pathway signal protein, partial [Verrucomicrobiae bacterium]|nr:twin-arginine translocation pathway signal protein [Verrucomicrobiae bacterium]
MRRPLLLVVVLAAAFGAQAQTNLIVPSRSLWRYSDANEWLGTSWMLPIVDDSRWALGRAPLGYGKPNVSIIREVMTAYFRHSFTLTNAPESWLTLRVRRDDGVIVYLNGAEVFRSNMP